MTLYRQLELGGSRTYAGAQAELIGRRSSFTARMGYFATETAKMDIGYNVVQRGRRTKSDMTFDGALAGHAAKTFRGTIDLETVPRVPPATSRKMSCCFPLRSSTKRSLSSSAKRKMYRAGTERPSAGWPMISCSTSEREASACGKRRK
jgi:hypothetical protein